MSTPRFGQPLGARETQVLLLVSDGLSYGEAASRLQPKVSENTAKAHMQNAFIKLGARSAAHAVFLACQAGILDGRPRRHGDHAGYEAHRRRGETICDLCRAGERAHRKAMKKTSKQNREAA
ncbi:LuxR C-terminal-related transcriptional regulator [Streptomyces sp. NBC_00250]|uniref:response regulator transcription factor n=1 Tax=Streptomyces sp. NBC_00250 TaxID=2903641 RepID=UPI002E284097|nr:LuxR C-terminal-related transcriptional regulator [Streptomyces sp. NBC_00250]